MRPAFTLQRCKSEYYPQTAALQATVGAMDSAPAAEQYSIQSLAAAAAAAVGSQMNGRLTCLMQRCSLWTPC